MSMYFINIVDSMESVVPEHDHYRLLSGAFLTWVFLLLIMSIWAFTKPLAKAFYGSHVISQPGFAMWKLLGWEKGPSLGETKFGL